MSGNTSCEIADLPNLGPASARMLAAAGITTRQQLQQFGPVKAYLAAKQAGMNPSMNLVWAIAGALRGVHWAQLPESLKASLRAELESLVGE